MRYCKYLSQENGVQLARYFIPTGTPAGVAAVQPGDRIQVEINGLGLLENQFAAE